MAREPDLNGDERRRGDDHWLTRTGTVRLLWRISTIALGLLVVLGLLIENHPHFGIDGLPGFSAWFGFGSCVVLVLAAKGLGMLLKRPDTTYED